MTRLKKIFSNVILPDFLAKKPIKSKNSNDQCVNQRRLTPTIKKDARKRPKIKQICDFLTARQ